MALTNLSLQAGTTATQSSTFGGNAASNAKDNNTGTWSHTNSDFRAWLQMDLGDAYRIEQIGIANRGDGVGGRLNNGRVQYWDGGAWQTAWNWGTFWSDNQDTTETLGIPISARQWRIRLDGTNYLHVTEFRLWGDAANHATWPLATNASLGGGVTATQSSTNGGNAASNAKDGNPATYSHTNSDLNAYLRFDLGAATLVEYVTLMNRQDDNTLWSRCSDFTIQSSPDDSTWTTRISEAGSLGQVMDWTLSPAVSARYWRVRLNGTNYLHLAEFELWGDGDSGSNPAVPGGGGGGGSGVRSFVVIAA